MNNQTRAWKTRSVYDCSSLKIFPKLEINIKEEGDTKTVARSHLTKNYGTVMIIVGERIADILETNKRLQELKADNELLSQENKKLREGIKRAEGNFKIANDKQFSLSLELDNKKQKTLEQKKELEQLKKPKERKVFTEEGPKQITTQKDIFNNFSVTISQKGNFSAKVTSLFCLILLVTLLLTGLKSWVKWILQKLSGKKQPQP